MSLGIPSMLFFKRILKEPAPEIRRAERRGGRRLPIRPDFPLRAVLVFAGRGGTIGPMSTPGGWDWPGQLLDCSAEGARVQVSAAALKVRGDFCDLDLRLDGFRLFVPCEVTNVRIERGGAHFGLKHTKMDDATRAAYRQFLAIVAMGATLKASGKAKTDASVYLVEHYAGDGSRLTVWRVKADKKPSAFEFALEDCLVRAAKGRPVEYIAGNRAASPAKAEEIRRLFGWVVANLPETVPADVQAFLRQHAD